MSPFFLMLILVTAGSYGQMDPFAKDAVVTGPKQSNSITFTVPSDNPSTDYILPTGYGLLRFYGCVTCQELLLPRFRGQLGPDLDTIGSKTTAAWLSRVVESSGSSVILPQSDSGRSSLYTDRARLLIASSYLGVKLDFGREKTFREVAGLNRQYH